MKDKMTNIDFDVLCRKAEELRAIFILGQRLIPFVEDIFKFVSDIKPLLDDINASMSDNMSKMQNASVQLSKVTEATETATSQIIDIITGLTNKAGIIAGNMKRLNELDSIKYDQMLAEFETIFKEASKEKGLSKYASQLSDTIEKFRNADDSDYLALRASTDGLLDSIGNDSNSVIMSLQVQDITSQQIAAVNHLLETIHDRLGNILIKFQPSDVRSLMRKKGAEDRTVISTLHRPIAFNSDDDDSSYFSLEDINNLFAGH